MTKIHYSIVGGAVPEARLSRCRVKVIVQTIIRRLVLAGVVH